MSAASLAPRQLAGLRAMKSSPPWTKQTEASSPLLRSANRTILTFLVTAIEKVSVT